MGSKFCKGTGKAINVRSTMCGKISCNSYEDDDVDREIIVVTVVSRIIMIIVFMAIIVIIENIINNIIINRPFLEKDLSYECNIVTISKFDTQRMLNKYHLIVLISYAIIKGHTTT